MTLFELVRDAEIEILGSDPLQAADRWDHGRAVHLLRHVDKFKLAKLAWPSCSAARDTVISRGLRRGDWKRLRFRPR